MEIHLRWSQVRDAMANMPTLIINGVLPLYPNSNKAWPLSEHTKSLWRRLSSTRRTIVLCPPLPEVPAWKEIQIRLLGHYPTVRKYRTRADRSPGDMLYNIGNSERARQELRCEWLLSTVGTFFFFGGSRDGSEGVWVSCESGRRMIRTNPRGGFFLYIGNSVFVDPVREPCK
jgi:hypothetical protein